MARIRYNHNSFSIGVLSKKVRGNTEFEGYNNGLDECVNFRIQHTGGCFKRGGTYFVAETRNNEAILIPFIYSSEQSYVCEFGDLKKEDKDNKGYIRFFTIHGVLEKQTNALHAVLNNYGAAVEVFTPFKLEEIRKFKYFQNGNILTFITNDGIYLLERTSATSFSFEGPEPYTCEPMDFINTDDVALYPIKEDGSKFTGEEAKHIGWDPGEKKVVPFLLIPRDPTNDVGESVDDGRPDHKYAPLFYDSDKDHFLVLNYYHPSEGRKIYYLKITDVKADEFSPGKPSGFNCATVIIDVNLSPGSEDINGEGKITGDIIYKLPKLGLINKWQLSAVSKGDGEEHSLPWEDIAGPHEVKYTDNGRGYPKSAAIFDGRMFLADGNKIWGSSVQDNDNFNFQLGTNTGDGVQFRLDMQNADEMLWLASQSKLFVGTRGGIYLAGAASYNDEAISPSNFRVRLFEAVGVSPLQPVMAMDSVFFVDSSGKNVHEIVLSGETGTFKAQDLSLLSSDLTRSGIIAHAWQQNPTKTYWCAVRDGYLCSLTYLKSNGVLAWAKHVIAGKNVRVESLVSIHGSEHDYLWMIVQREMDGEIRRFIEYMHPQYEALDDEQFRQFYVDSGAIKEDKHIIENIERSSNAHVTVDMSSVMNMNLVDPVVVFKLGGHDSHPLASRKLFIAKNVTKEGFDVYEDFRDYNNPKVKYGKIDPDLCGDSDVNVDVFVKVSNITGFTPGTATKLQCDSQYIFDGDIIVICNSNIGFGGEKFDFNLSGKEFRFFKNDNQNITLKNMDGSDVESDNASLLDNRGEIFKKINTDGIGVFKGGTNTIITLKEELSKDELKVRIGNLNSMAYNGIGIIIAVSSAGIAYVGSDSGTKWKPSLTTGMGNLTGVAYGGTASNGYFVAVNSEGKAWISNNNGQTWTASSTTDMGNLTGVAYGGTTSTSYFIAVNSEGKAWRSDNNGQTWTVSSTTNMGNLTGVAYGGTASNGYFIAVSKGGKAWRSDNNGQAWRVSLTINMGNLTGVAFGGSFFVAVNSIGEVWRCYYSDNRWSNTTLVMGNFVSIAFHTASTFVAINSEGKVCLTRDAGSTWTLLYEITDTEKLLAVKYERSTFIITGENGVVWKGHDNGSGCKRIKQDLNDVYINKVVGTGEINDTRYKIHKVSNDGKKIILCDYAASPIEDIPVVLDSSKFSAYDKSVENNGNAYIYFSEVNGLEHLSGQNVSICANGNIVTQIIDPSDTNEQKLISPVVKDGKIKLQHPAMFCAVGLPMKAWMKTLPFSGGSSLGSSVGSAGGQKSAMLHLYYSLGGRYGSEKERTYEIPYPSRMDKTYDKPADLYIGLVKAPVVNARDTTDRSLYIEHSEPLSFNILSITQDIQVSDA